jgi:hypothetical protein
MIRATSICSDCKDYSNYHADDERCEVCRFYDADTDVWHLEDKEKIDAKLTLSS